MKRIKSNKFPSHVSLQALFLAAGLLTFSPPCVQAQTGPPTNNLQLWLKADAGVKTNASGGVTEWDDQSTNQFDATPPDATNAPVYLTSEAALNNKPSIQFNPGQWLQLQQALDLTNDVSAFVVLDAYAYPGKYRGIFDQGNSNAIPFPNQWLIDQGGASRIQRGDGGTTYPTDWDYFLSSGPVPTDRYAVLGFSCSNNATTQYLDDVYWGNYTFQSSVAGAGVPILIGSRYPSGSPLNGEIAELLMYSSSLDTSDVAAVWTYLSTKYNIQYSPPTVAITNLTNGEIFAAPATVGVAVAATAVTNSNPSVSFYVNGISIATVSSPPYAVPLIFGTSGTALLTAVATDNLGFSATSAVVSLTITGPAATFTPGTNLQLWLKADAGVTADTSGNVSAWADQSGQNNNAVSGGSTPPVLITNAVNGEPGIHMYGSNGEYLLVANSASLEITNDIACLVVLKAPADDDYRSVWYEGGNCGYPSPNGLMLAPFGEPTPNRGTGCNETQDLYYGINNIAPYQYALLAFSQSGTTMTQFLNGIPNGTQTSSLLPIDGDGNSPLYIGTRGDFYDLYTADLEVAELLIFNTALPGTNLTAVQNYLANKYGIVLTTEAPIPAPTVAITAPANGAILATPTNLAVTVTAAAPFGTVANVQLFANGNLIATAVNPPYQFSVLVTSPGNVVLTAVATDNLGATSTNATVSLTATGAAPPSSPVTSGLQLWLKGDVGITVNASGDVTNWADQSGYTNNATQDSATNAPLLVTNEANGKPVVRFEAGVGNPVYMSVNPSTNLTLAGDVTSFAVIRIDDYSVRHGLWNQDVGGNPGPNDWSLLQSGIPLVNRGDGTGNYFAWYGEPLTFQPSAAPGQFFILGWEGVGLTMMTHFFNDQTNSYQDYGSIIQPVDVGNPLLIGTRPDFAEQLKGDMAELLIYDRALSPTELTTVEEYLAGRYAIPFASSSLVGPSVSILTPANGSTLEAPANFDVTAVASAAGSNTISNVQLFVNGASFGALSAAPYRWPVLVASAGTVTLKVTATDSQGATKSATTTINVTAPTYTGGSNLVLWLRADVGVTTNGSNGVAQWADQSSYGNNAVAGTTADGTAPAAPPILIPDAANGEPGIHFYNSGAAVEYMQVPDSTNLAVTGNMACLLVCKYLDLPSYYCAWTEGGSSGYPSPNGLLFATGGQPLFYRGNGSNSQDLFYGNNAVESGQYSLLTFSQAGATATQYLNGVPNGVSTATEMPYADPEQEPLYIGARGDFYNLTSFDIEIAEFMIFNSALTGTNLNNVNQYLIAKYGLVPAAVGQPPTLSIVAQSGNSVVISWPQSYTGYTLQSVPSLSSTNWAAVPGVVGNQVTVTPLLTDQFYRLQSP